MSLWLAVLYGVIQGLGEFLPISSSAHLALLPVVTTSSDPGVFFDLSMHIGTALAVIIYFKKELASLTKIAILFCYKRQTLTAIERFRIQNFFFATLASVILAFLLRHEAATAGRSPTLIAFNLLFFGLLMAVADRYFPQRKEQTLFNELKMRDSLLIGLAQAIAVFPGVSRSGITITTGRFLGYSKEEISRFSFILSLPIILGGFIIHLPEALKTMEASMITPFIVGMIVSFVVGILTVHFFMKFVSKIELGYFSLYRFLLAFLIMILL